MELNEYIALTCPNCGSIINTSKVTPSTKCSYCGTQLIVREGVNGFQLESFTNCPICNKNDKVEKISAIVSSQDNKLSKKLQPPIKPLILPEPNSHSTWMVILILLGIGTSIFGLISGEFSDGGLGVLGGLIYIIPILLLRNSVKNARKKYQDNREELIVELPRWEAAMNEWNKKYYCFRDDIEFIPGEKNEQMKNIHSNI